MAADATPLHPRVSLNSVCFTALPWEQQRAIWQRIASPRISLIAPQLEANPLAQMAADIEHDGCQVETIVHNFVIGPLSPNPRSWSEPRQRLSRTIEAAQRVGAKGIYMLTGGHGDLTWEEAADAFCAAIAPCVAQANEAGIQLMIENAPAQYADIHIAHTLRDTVALAEQAGIGVCIDLFFCWAEAGLQKTIERAVPRCGLIQVSDYVLGDRNLPARAVPGDGTIPFVRQLGWALAAGYSGAFELELIGPRIDSEGTEAACARAAQRLSQLLQQLNA